MVAKSSSQHKHENNMTPVVKVFVTEKASLNGHHDRQYLDVTITFTNFNYFTTSSKAILANQIYDGNISLAIRNMQMVSNNLTP